MLFCRSATFTGYLVLDTVELLGRKMQKFLTHEARVDAFIGPFNLRYTVSLPTAADPKRVLEYKIHPGDISHLFLGPIDHTREGSKVRFSMRVPPFAIHKVMDEITTYTLHASVACTFSYLNQPIVEKIVRKATAQCIVKCMG